LSGPENGLDIEASHMPNFNVIQIYRKWVVSPLSFVLAARRDGLVTGL
jgi:hypothetical protein